MIINIQTTYKEIDAQKLFNQIADNATKILKLDKNYVLSVIFCDSEYIHKINLDYRNIDRSTDVISFALLDNDFIGVIDDDEIELGDIFINLDACEAQAKEYGHSFERELGFLFTHGLLHLLGYDHMNEEDEKVMFTKQKEILDEIVSR